jgi:hypothetical protein
MLAGGDPTAWLRMQSDAKRSRGANLPAILRFAGRISKIAGKREFDAAEFPNKFKLLDVVLPRLRKSKT